MEEAFRIFISFLEENDIIFVRLDDFVSTVDRNFDLLTEELLRLLISKAIQERDNRLKNESSSSSSITDEKSLLGSWGIIIDTIRQAKLKRQELAVKNISSIMSYSHDSNPQNLIRFLRDLHTNGKIDSVFKQILENSHLECLKHGHEDSAAAYQFSMDVITRLDKQQSKQSAEIQSTMNPPPVATTASITNTAMPVSVSCPTISNTTNNNNKIKVNGIDNNNNNDDDDNDDDNDDQEYNSSELELAGQKLNNLLNECKGDAKALKIKLLHQLQSKPPVLNINAYLHVLNDNISACQQAGYVNKLKLFEFIQTIIKSYMKQQEEDEEEEESNQQSNTMKPNHTTTTTTTNNNNNNTNEETDYLSSHHAPQFVDSNNNTNPLKPKLTLSEYPIVTPDHFINGFDFMTNLLQTNIKNMKKKSEKKLSKIKVQQVLLDISHGLETNSWAVCDSFLSIDLVRRVRIESNLFKDYYEQSEIWIGKQSDIGAQIQIPSVRGDKVLWMCGGHNNPSNNNNTTAPENSNGMSRSIQTYNEIEPCKLEIKSSAPIKKFMALKELINCIDKLVYSLKPHVKKLNRIYDRSDAMLAVYPGGGSRFARHIDNTTNDGRRLTVLVYLNVNWKNEDGGALRLTPRLKEYMSDTNSSNNNNNNNNNNSSSSSSGSSSNNNSNSNNSSNTNSNQQQQQDINSDTAQPPPQQVIDILPIAGRVAMFYSAEIPHEVMPTFNQRHAITLWYYDSDERLQAIQQAQDKGVSATVAKSSVASQLEVKNFMSELMGGSNDNNNNNNNNNEVADKINEDGGEPNVEEVKQLAEKVRHLSEEALMIVSSITGAPSVQSFKEGFELLTPSDLKNMRALFQRMGLN